MSLSNIQPIINKIRNQIEEVENKKLQISMMYQYLVGASADEVAGQYRPNGYDVTKKQITLYDSALEIVIFKITRIKTEGKKVFTILPLDEAFDPWVKIVYDYMQSFKENTPFDFEYDLVDTSKSFYMTQCGKTFDELPPITPKENQTREKPIRFTSKHLKEYRLRDLVLNYNFNLYDLAYFGDWNLGSDFFKVDLEPILEEILDNLSEDELIQRAYSYISKLLKKNEIDKVIAPLLNQVECYFAIYCYEKIKDGDYKNELISETAQLLNKTESDVIKLLQTIAYLDPAEQIKKPFEASVSKSVLLEKTYNWFSSNRNDAFNYFSTFYILRDSENPLSFQPIENIENKADEVCIEEGQSKDQILNMRRRSQALVFEAKLRCQVCGYVKPEAITREIVEIHHLTPLKELDKSGVKRVLSKASTYVIPLCPICHRIAHSANPFLSIDEIKVLYSTQYS